MPPSEQPRVFISYAHKDGADLAQRLHSDLNQSFDTWLDIHRLTAGDVWSREIEDAIDPLKLIVAGDAGGHLHFLRLEEPKPKS